MAYGDALPSDVRRDGEVSVIGSGGVSGSHVRPNTLGPAVIVGRKGSYGSIHWSDRPAHVIDTAYYIDSRHSEADLRWLYYALQLANLTGVTQDVGVPGLSRAHAYASVIPSPPSRDEQRRIADFLDAETSRLDRLSSLRRRQRSLVIERNFTWASTRLVPTVGSPSLPHDEWPWLPSTIPDGRWVRLGSLAEIQTGVTVYGGRKSSERDVTRPYLRVANVQAGSLDLTEIAEIRVPGHMARSSTLRTGDVVVTEANGNIGNLGRGAVWKGQIKHCLHQNHIFAIRADPDRLSPEYLAVLTASLHGRLYFSSTATQVGIATTSSSKLRAFPIPLRASEDQEAITRVIHREQELVDRSVRLIDQQLALLSERRQALIAAAVTGQVDVTTARAVADRGP